MQKSAFGLKYKIICVLTFIAIVSCESSGIDSLSETDVSSSSDIDVSDSRLGRGHALSFNGSTDYIVVPHHESLNLTDGFTITAWIHINEYVEWASIVAKGGVPGDLDGTNNYSIQQSGPDGGGLPVYQTEFGHLRFTGAGQAILATSPESSTVLSLKQWYFITAIYDGTFLRYYVNGRPDGVHEIGGPLIPNKDSLYIALDPPGADEYWNGTIDELKIWNKPLNKGQLRAAMNRSATPMRHALVGYWPFNEGSGTVAKDHSRFRNHGTLVGSPTWVAGAPARF